VIAPPPPPAVQVVTAHSESFVLGNFATLTPKVGVRAPERDGWVTHMNAVLVDMHGRRVRVGRVMLHHILFLNDGAYNGAHKGSCAGRHGEPFYGSGEEHQELRLPQGYGYRVHARDNWRMQVMLMSHSLPRLRVRVRYRYTFVRGRRLTPVRPFWIRANGCYNDQPSYTVYGGGKPGSVARKRWRWRVPFDGRIVAAGGHLHGGSLNMTLTDPGCGGRTLLDTAPLYGRPDHPAYAMRPILHEPGPINTRYFLSRRGIPVRRGQILDLTGLYDAEHPRPRVMSIMHVYVARGGPRAPRCAVLPRDRRELRLPYRGRTQPPYVRVPLNGLGAAGRTYVIDQPPGATRYAAGDVTTVLRGSRFLDEKLSIPFRAHVTWVFADPIWHNVLYANGPRVHGTPVLRDNRRFTVSFDVHGTYQFFCYLHPMTMHQQVTVR
jgi:hypothetical protein